MNVILGHKSGECISFYEIGSDSHVFKNTSNTNTQMNIFQYSTTSYAHGNISRRECHLKMKKKKNLIKKFTNGFPRRNLNTVC